MNDDILKFLQAIWTAGEVREIRAFDEQGWPLFGYFDSPEKAAQAVQAIEKTHTVYVTLNPVQKDLLARSANRMRKPKRAKPGEKNSESAGDANIVEQKFLLIDLDPKRLSGISATAEEKEKARLLAEKIIQEIGKQHIYALSGNGYHLIYRHNAKRAEELSSFLKALDARYSIFDVQVDTTTFNPSRITKVIGTWARKGDNTPERPWTQSKLLEVNQDSVVLSIPEIEKSDPVTKPSLKETKTTTIETAFDVRSFLSEHGVGIAKEKAIDGGRTMLVLQGGCVFNSSHTEGEASICLHDSGLITYQCFHNSCKGRTWQDFREHIRAPKKETLCRTCRRPITFSREGEKWIPIEDGARHFCNRLLVSKTEPSGPESESESEPEPESEIKLPNANFDLSTWHPVYKRYLEQFSQKTDAPDQFIAHAFTVALAASLGNRVFLNVGFRIYPNLYAMIVAASTEFRKTTSIGLGVLPLKKLNSEKKKVYKQFCAQWKAECEGVKPKERPSAPPHMCNIYPEEITPESLLNIMEDKPDGLFFFSEIGTFLSMMEKNYGKGLKEMLTAMYDVPEEYSRETLSGGEIIIERPCPSLIAASTPEWIQKHVSESDMFSGFLARFQIAILRDLPKAPIAIPDIFSIDLSWVEIFRELEKFNHSYKISPVAKEMYNAWFLEHREKIKKEDEFLKSFLLREETVVHKLAIIYQALDDVMSETKSETISPANYSYAFAKAQWDIENIASCYSELISPPDYTQIRILEILKKHSDKDGRMCKRDLAKKAHLRIKEFDEIVSTLKLKGYVTEESKGKHTHYKVSK